MTVFWFKINYCCYFILELSENAVLGKGCAKMVWSPFHLKGFVLHCLVTHCDIWEVICSFRWCAGQIKMMEDLQDGYHSNAHNTHTPQCHIWLHREKHLTVRLLCCSQWWNNALIFLQFLGQRTQVHERCDTITWGICTVNSTILEPNDAMYYINPECA